MTMSRLHSPADPEVLAASPWLRRLPLRSPTLPPATHTNLYVVGQGAMLLVDPGTPDGEENDRALRALDELASEGHRVTAILLSHHHYDHMSGLEHLQGRLGVPLWAHAKTAERLRARGLRIDRFIEEGERLPFGPQGLRALLTPGHAPGHLCLLDEESGGLIAGDMVASVGTILIETSDGGDMRLYMESLRRLLALQTARPLRIWPAHGASVEEGATLLRFYLHHRQMREDKVAAALRGGATTLLGLVPRAYDDKPDIDPFLAARALLAHLHKLRDEGAAQELEPDVWAPR